jgi:hypothetical protein
VRPSVMSVMSVRPSVMFVTFDCLSDKVHVHPIRINAMLTLDRVKPELLSPQWLPHRLGLSYWATGYYMAVLTGGWASGRAGGLVHYVWYEPYILDIFSEYSLKIPQIYSNISLSGGRKGLLGITGEWAGVRTTLTSLPCWMAGCKLLLNCRLGRAQLREGTYGCPRGVHGYIRGTHGSLGGAHGWLMGTYGCLRGAHGCQGCHSRNLEAIGQA